MIQGYEKVFDTSANYTQEIVIDNLTSFYDDWHFSINCQSEMFDSEGGGAVFNSISQTMQMTLNTLVDPETINAHFQTTTTNSFGNKSLYITGDGTNGQLPVVGRYSAAPNPPFAYGNINIYVSKVLASETNGALFAIYSHAAYADTLNERMHASECWGIYQSHDPNLDYLKSLRLNLSTSQRFVTFQLTGYGRI